MGRGKFLLNPLGELETEASSGKAFLGLNVEGLVSLSHPWMLPEGMCCVPLGQTCLQF
jgi:hypothetical protein